MVAGVGVCYSTVCRWQIQRILVFLDCKHEYHLETVLQTITDNTETRKQTYCLRLRGSLPNNKGCTEHLARILDPKWGQTGFENWDIGKQYLLHPIRIFFG